MRMDGRGIRDGQAHRPFRSRLLGRAMKRPVPVVLEEAIHSLSIINRSRNFV